GTRGGCEPVGGLNPVSPRGEPTADRRRAVRVAARDPVPGRVEDPPVRREARGPAGFRDRNDDHLVLHCPEREEVTFDRIGDDAGRGRIAWQRRLRRGSPREHHSDDSHISDKPTSTFQTGPCRTLGAPRPCVGPYLLTLRG